MIEIWDAMVILIVISFLFCMVGFYKNGRYLAIGYGLAITGIGMALIVIENMWAYRGTTTNYIQFVLLMLYGIRMAGFLLMREVDNATYLQKSKESSKANVAIRIIRKIALWLLASGLCVAQTLPVFFPLHNDSYPGAFVWIGIVICVGAIALEVVSDIQNSLQKKEQPGMVATKGVYRLVRYPHSFGEILFWTGILVSSLGSLIGFGQWIVAILSYVCIVLLVLGRIQRSERIKMKRYRENGEYLVYVSKTPILIPFVKLYHLSK